MTGWLLSHKRTTSCLPGQHHEGCGDLSNLQEPSISWAWGAATAQGPSLPMLDEAEPRADVGAGRVWQQLDRGGWCHLIPQPACSSACMGAGSSQSSHAPRVGSTAECSQQAALKLGREGTGYVWWQKAGVHLKTWRQRFRGGHFGVVCVRSASALCRPWQFVDNKSFIQFALCVQ